MADLLPSAVREAAALNTAAGIRAIYQLEQQDRAHGVLALWALASTYADAEYARVLALRVASPATSLAQACRLWLMEERAGDVGVAHTLLGILESDAVERRQWSPAIGGALDVFLRSCLRHSEPSVRVGVLSVLSLAHRAGLLAATFPAVQGRALGDELEKAVRQVVEEEECADLEEVLQTLRCARGTWTFPFATRTLARVELDLLDWVEQHQIPMNEIDSLLKCVRRRVLLDDAGVRAARTMRPLLTVRVLADRAHTRLVQAISAFNEAVVGVIRQPVFDDVSAPDFGTEMAWAPAASVPMHLYFAGDADARQAFHVLDRLVVSLGSPAALRTAIGELDPVVADALLGLVERLRQHDGHLEVVLTDPDLADFQRSVRVEPQVLGRGAAHDLMRHVRENSRRSGVVIHRNHVPQANTVEGVFQAVDAMLERGQVTLEDIEQVTSDRQVNYYKHGARVLGFFDEDNQPTGRARAIAGLSYAARLQITAIFFEDTPIGRAWRVWSRCNRLTELDPDTASQFLEECVVGLSGTTPGRRASTLRRWLEELVPHYPGAAR